MDAYRDRMHAGSVLADELLRFTGTGAIVLGVPRGGVVVAAPVAARLDAVLDIVVARKLGAPGNQELAIGAVAGSGAPVIDHDLTDRLRVDPLWLSAEVERQVAEVVRREAAYRQGRPPPQLDGRTVIVVDDGVATGATLRAALRWVNGQDAARVVCAVPVGPKSTLKELDRVADEVVCPLRPTWFRAVGEWYLDFRQTEDDEVLSLLQG